MAEGAVKGGRDSTGTSELIAAYETSAYLYNTKIGFTRIESKENQLCLGRLNFFLPQV